MFSADPVQVIGEEGAKVQDEFTITSENEVPIKGIIYSSNPYVRVLRPQFEGTEVTVRFEVRGQHYSEGDHLQGYFTIVYNGGEHRLPFDVQFSTERLLCSIGEITSLEDFANLAKAQWNEAMQLFYSDAFGRFMQKRPEEERLMYVGYRRAVPSPSNLEAFLVAAGLKERVEFSVKEKQEKFYHILENRKETLVVSKSSWGYIEIDVESDNDFVTVEKEHITSDYFLGSTMLLNYYIHKNRMHAGKNYARITFSCKGKIQEIELMATTEREDVEHTWVLRERKKNFAELTKTYQEYRLRRMTTGDWCNHSVEILNRLIEEEGTNNWYYLMKAQCYIVNKQRQEALWIIQDMKRDITDKSSVEWAYLLYLCTLIEQEESYVNRLTREIEVIFRQHPEDPRMFWFLSFLQEEYVGNSARKLRAIMQWITAGNPSPFLYIEAFSLYVQDPYLLHDFSDNAVRVMYWAAKRDALTPDLAVQVAHAVEKADTFSEKIWFIIQKAYEIYPDKDFLINIVAFLLRNQMYQERFLHWYKQGIQEELRLNGLYEAYMMTLPDTSTEEIPQMVQLYFRYSCNLPYQKKALLYANVILNRKSSPQLYEQYLRAMEMFAIEQMKLNRMNDNLAIVYQNILEMGIVDEEMAKAVSGLVFMKKLVCVYPDIARVFVYQEQYEMPIVVPVIDGVTYVPILSEKHQIFLETRWGTVTTDKQGYRLQRILFPERYIDRLKNLAPLAIPFILEDFGKKNEAEQFDLSDFNKMDTFLHSSLVSKKYIQKKYPVFVQFLRNHCREELLEKYFTEEVVYDELDNHTLSYIMTLFISQEHYEAAFDMMDTYYGLDIEPHLLLHMCNELIIATEFAPNERLQALCFYLLEQELTTAATIAYLAKNQVGPTEWMLRLWEKAKEDNMYVMELEENLLFQALYAENCVEKMFPVYESYMTRGKDKMLLEAYLNFWSHEYMLAHEGVPEALFTLLAYNFDKEIAMKESCNLAYMKFLSTVKLLSDREFHLLDRLLRYYILRNMYFGFYKDVDQRLIIKYHLYDKYFVEYRGNPGEHISIVYSYNDKEPVEEEMIEIYEGIFVKQFVIFFGESIEYQLYSDQVQDLPVSADKLVVSSSEQEGQKDRYDLINRMQNAFIYNEKEELARNMKLYQGLDSVTSTLFTTL